MCSVLSAPLILQGTEPEDAQREYMDIILAWPAFGSSVHPVKVG